MASAKAARPERTELRVGRLTKAHGLKGALKIELYTDDPARRFTPGATFSLQVPPESPWHGKTLELVELRWYNTHAVGFFKDVPDRTTAESLRGASCATDHATEVLGVHAHLEDLATRRTLCCYLNLIGVIDDPLDEVFKSGSEHSC